MIRVSLVSFAIILPLGLGSCGGVGHGKLAASLPSVKGGAFSVGDLFPSRVKVVKARQKDLKELPLGRERAVAYEKQRKLGFWTMSGSAEFVQPALPEPGAEMDGSLLPPKNP